MASDTPRVGTTTLIRPGELSYFHRNARKGDVPTIMGSLKINGQYAPIVGNIGTKTGRPLEILAGNHTLEAFRALAELNPFDQGWSLIKVHWVDVDDAKAEEIVLVDNRSHDAGEGTDAATVWELLESYGREGTGYTDEAIDKLERALNREAPEPPKPSLPTDKVTPISATITFGSEVQQQTWFDFVTWLRTQYPDPDLTVAGRVSAHLSERSR
jgi:hypothetical protein